ncbi:MAG: class I SAM-dependent methyltransferase [Chloroflexi bacterium]|nr:class I SAM-dependent methyltransferase [Chloroflexota bacterium]
MVRGLDAIVTRASDPAVWADGEKIPWNDPAFSERMLAEHLSQAHDAASRRSETIEAQVAWIAAELPDEGARILDLGCGPGLYANRLARLDYRVRGIDFSPASIRHARSEAERAGLEVSYELGDVRETPFGQHMDLVTFLYGELNVFRRAEVRVLLERAHAALTPGGLLLIEPHTFEAVRRIGAAAPRWSTHQSGLWSDRPHLVLEEAGWDQAASIARHRWFIVDAATGHVSPHGDAMQAYSDAEYRALLGAAGFGEVALRADWPSAAAHEGDLVAYTARAS